MACLRSRVFILSASIEGSSNEELKITLSTLSESFFGFLCLNSLSLELLFTLVFVKTVILLLSECYSDGRYLFIPLEGMTSTSPSTKSRNISIYCSIFYMFLAADSVGSKTV